MKAVGVHVFAGGFTRGAKRVADVDTHLEIHDFGALTAASLGVDVIRRDSWKEWPEIQCDVVYGNPRCSGFSTLTGSEDSTRHGSCAKCNQDIYDLCNYGVQVKAPIIVWESVIQAFSTGRQLIETLVDTLFEDYRVAHIFECAHTFGNAQARKRYFFVAYSKELKFNVGVPYPVPRAPTLRDVLRSSLNPERVETLRHGYSENSWLRLPIEDEKLLHLFNPGEGLMSAILRNLDEVRELSPKLAAKWDNRKSAIPYGLHQTYRTAWDKPCPTLTGKCGGLVHPDGLRTFTVGELSRLMGWDTIPIGRNPFQQISKGIIPDVGEWLLRQCKSALDGAWGAEDFESEYNKGEFFGRDTTGLKEKRFDFRRYYDKDNESNGERGVVESIDSSDSSTCSTI